MARSKAQTAALRQVLLAALSKYSEKEYERDQLEGGAAHQLDVRIEGKINGKSIEDVFKGALSVGFNGTTTKSVGPDQEVLIAWILDRYVDPSMHAQVFDELPLAFDKAGSKVPVDEFKDDGLVARCEALLKKLKARISGTRRGDVSLSYKRAEAA